MYSVKGQLSRTYFREMGSYFLDFVTQYFVGTFSEPPKSVFTNKFRNGSIFDKNPKNNRPSVKGQLGRSSFTVLVSFFPSQIL